MYKKFPTPLINRLEKHFVLTKTVLTEEQSKVHCLLEEWVIRFAHIEGKKYVQLQNFKLVFQFVICCRFQERDAFVGYQDDTLASVVLQATQQLQKQQGIDSPLEKEIYDDWSSAVLKCSKTLLLQIATPDAIVRLKDSSLVDDAEELSRIYFNEQHHGSIKGFLTHHLTHANNVEGGFLVQVC